MSETKRRDYDESGNKKIEKQKLTKIITDGRDEHRLQTTIFLPSNLAKKN